MSPKNVEIKEAFQLFLQNYTKFDGRSTRSEFWWVMLPIYILEFVLGLLSAFVPAIMVVAALLSLAILVPAIALEIRRFHDTGKSGYYILLNLVPMVGGLIVLFFLAQPGDPNPNQYGEPAGYSQPY